MPALPGNITCSANGFLGFVEVLITWVWRGGHVLALPRQQWIVLLPVVVGVEEFLKPLNELKVVLELPLHQLLYWDNLQPHKYITGKERRLLPGSHKQPFSSVSTPPHPHSKNRNGQECRQAVGIQMAFMGN